MSAFDRASAPQLPLDTTTGAVSTDDSACTTLLTPPPLPPANSASGQQSRASITTIAPTAGSKFRAFSADDGADRALNPDSLHRELSRPPVLDHPISLLSAAWSADNTLPVPLDDVERDRARTVKDKAILEASASSENAVDLDSLSTHLSSLDIGPLTRSTSSRQNHARWEGVGDTTGAATDGGRTIPKHVWDDRLLGVFRVLLYFFGVLPLSWPKLRASSFFRRTAQVVDVIAGNLAPAIVLFVISFMLVREFYIPYYLYTAERIAWICTRLAALTAWWVGFRYLRQRKFLHGAIESVHKQCHSYAIFRAKYASSNLQVRSTGVASENHLAGAPTAISLDDSESLATRRVRSPTTVREEEDTRKNSEFGVTKPSPLTRDIVRQLDLPTVQLETRYISRLAKTHTGVALFIGCIMYIPLSLREFGWSRVTRGNSDVGVQDWVLANATGQVYWAFLGVAGAVNILLPVVIASALSMLVHLLYWRIKRLLDVVKTIELFELPADMLPWISMMRQRIISDGSQISSAFFWPFVVLTGLLLLGPVILFVTLIATNGEHPHISHFAAGLGCFSLLCVLTASIQKLINAELELIRRANLLLQRGYAPAIAAGAPSTAATGGHPSGPGSHQRVRSISEAPARLLVAHVQANPALATRMQSVVSKPKTEVAAAEAATSTTGQNVRVTSRCSVFHTTYLSGLTPCAPFAIPDAIELPLKRVQEDRSLQGVASQYTAGSKLLDGQAAENAQIMRQEKRAPTSNTVDSAPNHPSSSAHADEPASSRQVTFSASASSSVTAGAADDDATAFLTESDRHELEQHRSETSEKQLIPMTSSDGGASNPVAKHVKRSGSSLLALISVVFKRQWRDAFIFLTIWLCYIIFRLFVGYPVCWNPTGNKGYCSDAEDTIRLVETAVTGHVSAATSVFCVSERRCDSRTSLTMSILAVCSAIIPCSGTLSLWCTEAGRSQRR